VAHLKSHQRCSAAFCRPVKFFHTDWIIISLWFLSYTQRHCHVRIEKGPNCCYTIRFPRISLYAETLRFVLMDITKVVKPFIRRGLINTTCQYSVYTHTYTHSAQHKWLHPLWNLRNSAITFYLEDMKGFFRDITFHQVCLISYQSCLSKLFSTIRFVLQKSVHPPASYWIYLKTKKRRKKMSKLKAIQQESMLNQNLKRSNFLKMKSVIAHWIILRLNSGSTWEKLSGDVCLSTKEGNDNNSLF